MSTSRTQCNLRQKLLKCSLWTHYQTFLHPCLTPLLVLCPRIMMQKSITTGIFSILDFSWGLFLSEVFTKVCTLLLSIIQAWSWPWFIWPVPCLQRKRLPCRMLRTICRSPVHSLLQRDHWETKWWVQWTLGCGWFDRKISCRVLPEERILVMESKKLLILCKAVVCEFVSLCDTITKIILLIVE